MTPSSTPKLTVCLPTYNRAAYLRQALSSILAQTAGDFELIVGDNCSADDTPEVIASVRDPRLRSIRHEANVGHYRNMNRCLELARGRYVCIVHDDDVYAPEFLARESQLLDRHPSVGMVHCAAYVVDADRRRRKICRVYPNTGIRPSRQEFIRYLGGHNVCCSTVMFRRSLWESVGPFRAELMCADWLMWLGFALRGDVGYIATPLVEMREHGVRMTSTMEPVAWAKESLEILSLALEMLERTQPLSAEARSRLQRRGARGQGWRFWIAALAAAAEGMPEQAAGYLRAIRMLEPLGLSRWHARTAEALIGPAGRRLLQPVRVVWRSVWRAGLGQGATW